ncbi:MAG: hypothetical protein Mars2KO_42230 [Maribacter sp.]
MKTLKKSKRLLFILFITVSITVSGQQTNETNFKPLHLVISVANVKESADWYITNLDFEMSQSFNVPSKGLSASLLKKGDFEVMLMKSKDSQSLPVSRKNTFTDLNVEGVKRIAFEVENLDKFISGLTSKGVSVDVEPRLFEDKITNVNFRWAIIKDNNGNLIEFVEKTEDESDEIEHFLIGWGNAWSPKEKANQFSKESLKPYYVQSDSLVAFDFTDSSKTTVIKGAEKHHTFWEPFMQQFNFWTFTPNLESVTIHTLTDKTASISLYVDNYGILSNGKKIEAKAHATLVLIKEQNNWKIIHENIWGPVVE